MIIRSLGKHLVPTMTMRPYYEQSRFQKLLLMIRRVLNKMANEETRTFKEHMQSNENKAVAKVQQTKPRSMEEATKLFLKNQVEISVHEKSRLQRIDEILGTKTYFQQTKPYQQRISNDSILQIEHLRNSTIEISRQDIDILNPQMGILDKLQKTRKYVKIRTNLKKYPSGNTDISEFQEKPITNMGSPNQENQALIKFLAQQELYVRFGLSQLNLTMQSINTQKLETVRDGHVINLQMEEDQFVHNQQVYFRPIDTLSIYRIDSKHFNRRLVYSVEALSEAIVEQQGHIQEVVTLDQIYECLQTFYYDDRVSDYLRRVENDELTYFFDSLQVSPDGNSIFLVIDLMDNEKEFVGLYKQLSSTGQNVTYIRPENALFNFRPQVALRNDGILYYIQRSQQGLYGQFCQTKFNTSLSQKAENKPNEKEIQQLNKQQKSVQKHGRNDKILYKCKPYQDLKILKGAEAKVIAAGKNLMSNNVLLQETDIGTVNNNKVYLFLHEINQAQTFQLQELTTNNSKLLNLIGQQKGIENKWETNAKNIFTECHEILGVGYLVVRYCFVSTEAGEKLKYGHNKRYAHYVSFIPYSGHKSDPIIDSAQIEELTQKQQYIEGSSEGHITTEQNDAKDGERMGKIQGINLPTEESALIIDYTAQSKQYYKLELEKQRIIYSSPNNQYITDLQVRHASLSNVYLLINNSVQSVYNRNSLYVHSLRTNVNPYSIYLDGYPMSVVKKNIGSGEIGKIGLKLQAPLLPINLQYTLWKKQIKEDINDRIHTETLTIKQDEQSEIIIKLISNSKYISRKPTSKHEVQSVILYLPSQNQRLSQNLLMKVLEKGVMIIQIVKCRGIFGSTMIELLRGSKQFYNNYIEDIYHTIVFIRQNISHRVSIYAEGPSSCYATLLLNIRENHQNQLFDCSVLHQGIYDTSVPHPKAEFFFGTDPSVFQNSNPFHFGMLDPSKSTQDESKQLIHGLSNIVFSSLEGDMRVESRKFVNKLRNHRKVFYDSVYLKQFHKKEEKDIFNLAFLYKIMNEKMRNQYNDSLKQKMEQIKDEGELLSRKHKDKVKLRDQDQ